MKVPKWLKWFGGAILAVLLAGAAIVLGRTQRTDLPKREPESNDKEIEESNKAAEEFADMVDETDRLLAEAKKPVESASMDDSINEWRS